MLGTSLPIYWSATKLIRNDQVGSQFKSKYNSFLIGIDYLHAKRDSLYKFRKAAILGNILLFLKSGVCLISIALLDYLGDFRSIPARGRTQRICLSMLRISLVNEKVVKKSTSISLFLLFMSLYKWPIVSYLAGFFFAQQSILLRINLVHQDQIKYFKST